MKVMINILPELVCSIFLFLVHFWKDMWESQFWNFVYICRWWEFFLLGASVNAEIYLFRFTWKWRTRLSVLAQLPPVKATSTWMPSWKPLRKRGPKLWVRMNLSTAAVSYIVSRNLELVFREKKKRMIENAVAVSSCHTS